MICISVFRLIPAHAGKTRTRPSTRRTPTAHPRSRGENQAITQPLVFVGGSSPLTRGKPVATAPSRLPIRLIPAHAGKTSHASSHAGWGWAHPRSRGENRSGLSSATTQTGSSPLTRGKRVPPQGHGEAEGLIPAHAGKTLRPLRWPPKRPGSSPLTRGKRDSLSSAMIVLRLIPAHAGKTRDCLRRHSRGPAHPRSRGENTAGGLDRPEADGSSPLTRGKHRLPCRSSFGRRLIPAHAGKTSPPRTRPASPWAHPRSRGENIQALDSSERAWGSSPLTRGKRVCQLVTPARGRAHPRSRGENCRARGRVSSPRGSSPLTRGKHSDETLSFHPARLIPAHAGKTCRRGEVPPRGFGSSPLTRGKPRRGDRPRARCGLIPAHAGKTTTSASSPSSRPAHPRSRGENLEQSTGAIEAVGSSPLTRGKRAGQRGPPGLPRLIPAHAGKTAPLSRVYLLMEAHPRSRGENLNAVAGGNADTGSSPLTRGKPILTAGLTRCIGLIPAHAGKTFDAARHVVHRAAHPRSRGENICCPPGRVLRTGSSPLTRGKHGLRRQGQP